MFLGIKRIDDLLSWTVNTHNPTTGAETDADAVPAYRVYEEETGTAILTGTMALLDDANTVGHYSEQVTLSAANGFEVGKSYSIRVRAVVGAVAGSTVRQFQVEAAPLTAAQVNVEVDTALADYDGPTNTEMIARTLPSASYGLEATLTAIKGGGWTTETLKAIKDAVDLKLATAGYTAPDNAGIAAIKAKTDNLPADPADESLIQASIAALAVFVDTEVAAIKAKTDSLTFTTALKVDAAFNAAADLPQAAADKVWLTAARALTDKAGFALLSSGLDLVIVEAGVAAGPGLVNDTGTQLTAINARQAMAAILSAVLAVLSGAATTTVTIRPAGKPTDAARVVGTVDVDGNRSAINLRVPD